MISVIIPVYNAEKYIDACLGSVLSQEKAEFEVVIVNDGSKDRTAERCREWLERYDNITYIEQENQGPGSARNCGISHALGAWLVFLDADDELMPGALHKLQEISAEGVDIVCYEFFLRRRQGKPVDEHIRLCEGPYRWNGDLLRESTSFLWDKMFRTEFWREKDIILEDDYGQDLRIVYLLEALCERFSFLREPLIRHYERDDNSSSNPIKVMQITKSIEGMVKAFSDRKLLEPYKVSLFYVVRRQYEIYKAPDFCTFEPEQLKRIRRELRRILKIYFKECCDGLEVLRKAELVQIGYQCRTWYGDLATFQRVTFFPELESFILAKNKSTAEYLLYMVDISQEGRCRRFGTRTEIWQKQRWEDLAGEFVHAAYRCGEKVLICIFNREDSRNQELYRMLVGQEGIYGMLDNTPVLELLIMEKLCFRKARLESGNKAEKANPGGALWCGGEQFRLQFNETILNAWLILKNRGQRLEAYFVERGYQNVAIYGMGYLGDRLLEELAEGSVNVLYGIDRERISGKTISVYGMEDNLPEADAIIVTVVHLFFGIRYELQNRTGIPVVSLEEVLETLLDLDS